MRKSTFNTTISNFQQNYGGFEPMEFIEIIEDDIETKPPFKSVNLKVEEMLKKYKTFSKNKKEAIAEMSKYFGDAGDIKHLFYGLKTAQDVLNGLSGINKINFESFLKDTRQGKYLSKLTREEMWQLVSYSMHSDFVNTPIRKQQISDVNAQVVNLIDSAIKKYGGLDEPMLLYRGVKISSFTKQNQEYAELFEGMEDWIIDPKATYGVLQSLIGEDFSDLGYMSTTPSYEASKKFGPTIILEIMADEGTEGAYINQISDYYNDENEFLLARGTVFEMLDVLPPSEDGKVIVRCKIKNNNEGGTNE